MMEYGPAMTNKTTVKAALKLVELAKILGTSHSVDNSAGATIHSFSSRNAYTSVVSVTTVVVRHPDQTLRSCGSRSSASVKTTVIDPRGSVLRSYAGTWDATYILRHNAADQYTWDKWMAILSGSLESANI